jgi:hypothetical protein
LREIGSSLHYIMVAVSRGRHLRFQMQPVVTIVVSFHRTVVITPLTVQPRVSIVLHKLNSVQPMSWCSMCFSCHIQSCIHSSRHSSTSTWQSGCCSSSLVNVAQYYLQVICFYVLDYHFGYFKCDLIRGIGYLLLIHSNPCTIPDKHGTNTPIRLSSNQNKHI